MKNNLGYYVQKINDIIQNTEETGDNLNEFYEVIDNGIENNTLGEIGSEELLVIRNKFEEGTKNYQNNLVKIKELKPPARLIGNHKTLEKAYRNFVNGCEEMTTAIDTDTMVVDSALFRSAESKQDQSTDTISNSIQKLTRSVLG